MIWILVLSFVPISIAWTGAVHFDIMLKAYNQASPIARRYLRHHLGHDVYDIARGAEWADSEDARARYPESEEFHFSHTPFRKCAEFVLERDCGFNGSGKCLVTGIAQNVMRATDVRLSLDDRADAIKFLIHLVSDIHQPLHTGFAKDAGGVGIKININPVMSLHQLWDFVLLQPEVMIGTSEPPSGIKLHQSFRSEQDVVEYASLLASESSTLYTCKSAYQSETGSYIKSGETLSPEYIDSRTRIAHERIVHAASRLADLLDVMGARFFELRARSVSKPQRAAAQKSDSSNWFAVLAFEFPAEEIADICEDSLEVYRRPQPVVVSSAAAASPAKERSEIEILEEAMAQAAQDRAAASLGEELSSKPSCPSTSVAGVELSSIVLIRRDAQFFLTRKELVIRDPLYRSVKIISYRVRFAIGKFRLNVVFLVDTELFGFEPISDIDFARVLLYLKHGEDVPDIASKGLVSSGGAAAAGAAGGGGMPSSIRSVEAEKEAPSMMSKILGRRVVNGYKIDPPSEDDDLIREWIANAELRTSMWISEWQRNVAKWKTKEEKYDFDFFSKLSHIFQYNSVGNIQGYFHRDTLLNTTNLHRRFNLFLVKNSGLGRHDQFFIIMDTAIFDGMITAKIQKGMYLLDSNARKLQDKVFVDRATTLENEMKDLHRILNKGEGTKMRVIKDLVQYNSIIEGEMMKVIEWNIKPREEYAD